MRIRQSWSPKIDGAADDAAAESMIEEARGEMAAAVEAAPGITQKEYFRIVPAARQQPKLAQAIEQRIRQATAQQQAE